MRLAQFIRSAIDRVLDQWEAYARDTPSASGLDTEALRDHAREMLTIMADYIERDQSMAERLERARGHGLRAVPESEAARAWAATNLPWC